VPKSYLFICLALSPLTAFSQTAWQKGVLHADTQAVIGRSDIVLARPNLDRTEAMPLGNGRLGVAVWAADGFTAQLNRNDTFPDRLSSGQVVLPGLAPLIRAADYSGRVDLYKQEFREQGCGMTAKAYVQQSTDMLVIDVAGADPTQSQTAILKLWSPRAAKASITGRTGLLAESWLDDKHPGASHRAFGSLSAITAEAREVSAALTDPRTITLTFKPQPDGHFRILAAAPHYDGKGEPQTIAAKALVPEPASTHLAWWQAYWNRAALLKINSPDSVGEYMENLRALYLYVAAIEQGYEYPGSQAGVADMISSSQDIHKWDPSAFWHFNLRMQVAANLSAGLPELNAPYFHLYTAGLADIEDWTFQHMNHRPGVCIPETMRFNGPGYEYEGGWTPPAIGNNCDAGFRPYYNARTLSTGAEVSLWAWRQYLATNDREFLAAEYPLMAAAARFLLAYQKPGPDNLLHTSPSNAHENQWDVTDPITDLSAIQALYPAVIEAATLLHKDPALVAQLKAALPKTPPFPRTQSSGKLSLLPPSADSENTDVLANSYQPEAEVHNIENLGLEPVWPYGIIGDTSPLFALARRTYEHRSNRNAVDWSFDPLQAARLGLGEEVASTLSEMTEKYQGFPNGMSKWSPEGEEFYVEQSGIVAAALPEAVVQDYDGLLRVAPALPSGWDVDARLPIRGKSWVDVQTRNGAVTTLVIEAGASQKIELRNPWPGQSVDVLLTKTGKPVLAASSAAVLEFPAIAGASYQIQPHGSATPAFAPITGTPATTPKQLGPVHIGLYASGPK
jgi:hypothetical protein